MVEESNPTIHQISVLLSPEFDAEQVARIKAVHPTLVIHTDPGGIPDEPVPGNHGIEAILRQVEVIVEFRLPRNIWQRTPRLKWVQYLGAGVEHLLPPRHDLLPVDELPSDLILTNASGIHAIPLAETALAMMLTLAKSLRVFEDQQRRRVWKHLTMTELHGKTLGIVALGRVGRGVAQIGRGVGMRVIACDPYVAAVDAVDAVDEFFPRPNQLRTMLAKSDFVVCCAPYTRETYHLLGAAEFRSMKSSAYFINVGRGQICDEEILIQALQDGWIAGAGLDAFELEPLPADSPLWDMPNVTLMPHQGSTTDRYMERATEIVCENLRRYVVGEPLLRVVDPVRGY